MADVKWKWCIPTITNHLNWWKSEVDVQWFLSYIELSLEILWRWCSFLTVHKNFSFLWRNFDRLLFFPSQNLPSGRNYGESLTAIVHQSVPIQLQTENASSKWHLRIYVIRNNPKCKMRITRLSIWISDCVNI